MSTSVSEWLRQWVSPYDPIWAYLHAVIRSLARRDAHAVAQVRYVPGVMHDLTARAGKARPTAWIFIARAHNRALAAIICTRKISSKSRHHELSDPRKTSFRFFRHSQEIYVSDILFLKKLRWFERRWAIAHWYIEQVVAAKSSTATYTTSSRARNEEHVLNRSDFLSCTYFVFISRFRLRFERKSSGRNTRLCYEKIKMHGWPVAHDSEEWTRAHARNSAIMQSSLEHKSQACPWKKGIKRNEGTSFIDSRVQSSRCGSGDNLVPRHCRNKKMSNPRSAVPCQNAVAQHKGKRSSHKLEPRDFIGQEYVHY